MTATAGMWLGEESDGVACDICMHPVTPGQRVFCIYRGLVTLKKGEIETDPEGHSMKVVHVNCAQELEKALDR
jgi:hypothetical protein